MISGLKSFFNSKIRQRFLKGIVCHGGKNLKPNRQVNIVLGGCKGACTDGAAELRVASGLFAAEPESGNQLGPTAEPWLAA